MGERRYPAILDAVETPLLKAQYDPSNCVVAGEIPYAPPRPGPAAAGHDANVGPHARGGYGRRPAASRAGPAARVREDRPPRRNRRGAPRLRSHLRDRP